MAAQRSARVLAIANQKGGVGKTTTAINLGTAITTTGARVLLIDSDPQGNASTGLGIPPANRERTLYDVLMDEHTIADAVVRTAIPGLFVVPAEADLSGVELELAQRPRRAFRLKDALDQARILGSWDYILIDCPPSLNLLTLNAMTAADGMLVPLQCEFFALEGLTQLLRTIDRVRDTLNPTLELQGVVLTMYDKRNSLSAQVARDVREHLGTKVYHTMIPRNVRISEAPSFGQPALIYDVKCSGSQAYIDLAKEVLARERGARLMTA